MLATLAVWGASVGADDLTSLLPGTADELDEQLERGISSGLLCRDLIGTVRFTHELFREVTYGELGEPRRSEMHRQAAAVLAANGYRPGVVVDHLLRAAGAAGDPALMAALREAVAATREYAPEVTADLLDDVGAVGADMPEQLLLDHADALFHLGRGEAAETLIRERITTVTDPAVAAQLQTILIRSLSNRADTRGALSVIERTTAIEGLPAATVRQLEGTRAWLLVQAGQPVPAAELDAMMATAVAAALTGYQRMGAVVDRDRALARARALGIRRGSRETHRDADFGWESLTVAETRIATLVRDGLTNREIGVRLYVSHRTVQTHVSHILQKTGLRSRVEIARFAGP